MGLPDDEFALQAHERDDRTVIVARGELDLANAPQLEAAVARAYERGAARVIVDLDGVPFIDSTGLRALLAAGRSARDGRSFAVTAGSDQVRRVFAVTGADSHLEIVATPDAS